MRALYLRQVNLLAGGIREEQVNECIAEDGGNFVDGLIEHGVTIAHRRSPWKTTHDDLRLAVESASGGCDRHGVLPCALTIYAAASRFVRLGVPTTHRLPEACYRQRAWKLGDTRQPYSGHICRLTFFVRAQEEGTRK